MSDYDPSKVRAKVAEWQKEGAFKHKLNAYECQECASYIVTIDREIGITPFMVKCGNCEAMALSKMYRVSEALTPTHEWYRPETIDGLARWSIKHVEQGGLMLRRVGGGNESEGWQDPSSLRKACFVDDSRAAIIAQKIASIEAEQDRLLKQIAEGSNNLKRENYPSRQSYRAAVSQARKRGQP